MKNLKRELALRGYAKEAKSFLRAARRGGPRTRAKRRFVLFGRGRSGSTLLVSLLGNHPQVDCLGEVLHYPSLAPVAFVEREMGALEAPCRGFKLLSYQLRDLLSSRQAANLRDWIVERDLEVFHMQRENLLHHAMSNIYARARNAFHSTHAGSREAKTIHVDLDDLVRWMKDSAAKLEWEERFLGDLPRHEILYETDLATPETQQKTLDRMVAALGLEPVPARSDLRKVTPRSYESFVSNWDEIRRGLQGTPYAAFLN